MGYGPSGFGTLRCSSAADGRKRSLGTPYCSPSLVSASCASFTSGGVCTCRSNYTGLKCSACDSGYLFDPHPYCKSGACRTTVWSAWSACSVTCGSAAAARFRTRSVRFVSLCQTHAARFLARVQHLPCSFPTHGTGATCPSLLASETCMGSGQTCPPPPPPVNCSLADWTSWSNCTAVCDGGAAQRFREVVVPQVGSGKS